MPYKDPEEQKIHNKLYYTQRIALFAKRWKRYYQKYPEKRVLHNIQTRCYNPKRTEWKDYGGRGIKNYLTESDILFLMKRDGYSKMKDPSINRKDNNGNYTLKNCQFIERGLNSAERNSRLLPKSIIQLSLSNKPIQKFNSIKEAAKRLKTTHQNIICCLKGRSKTACGFKWGYNA
jgi:hypothetical protein